MAYHYYQNTEHETWKVVEANQRALRAITKQGAKRVSILSVNEPITEDTDDSKIRYQGPFYIDLDSADIDESISSAREVLKKIKEEKIPLESVEIYCSGKKGFHFYFHQKLFSNGRPMKNLPHLYKRMSVYFYVPGLDPQVYCGGKGNLFRIANVQREDGRYKVRILPEELEALTKEQYEQLTSQPRSAVFPAMKAPEMENSFMLNAFTAAKHMMESEEKQQGDPGIPDATIQKFQNNPPDCIAHLAEYKIKSSANFNRSAFQMAIFLRRAAVPISLADSLMTKMADCSNSTSYGSNKERLRHIKGLYSYARTNQKRTFSCSAMRSILATRPCENCQISDAQQIQAETYEIEERPDGYYAVNAKTETRLTSFILTPSKMITTYNPESKQEHRIYTLCSVECNHETVGYARVEEGAWNSRSAFVASFNGMSNLKVTATDNDIQNLKHFILRDIEKIDTQEIVRAAGVHRDERYGKPRYTYVEEGLSANKWGQRNTHILELPVSALNSAMPRMQDVALPDPFSSRAEEALLALLTMNEPKTIAPIVGWLSACHLKAHIMAMRQEFPLINLWGGRGSGKTKTATTFSRINGVDYSIGAPPALPNTTPYAVTQTLTSTTTIPRILDEFNKGGMGNDRYSKYAELFKQAFNGSSAMRGRIAHKSERNSSGMGAIADSFHLTAPLMLLSEHATDLAALNDRTYKVMMSEKCLASHRASMLKASREKKYLLQIAKALTTKSLETREEWIEDRMDSWYKDIPIEYSERQALTRVVIGTGLDYLEHVVVDSLGMNLKEKILELKSAFLGNILDVSSQENQIGHSTEVDYLLAKLGELNTLTKSSSTSVPLSAANFKVDNDVLSLDLPTIFTLLRVHVRSTGERFPLPDAGQFQMLIRNEVYFISDWEMDMSMMSSRPVTKLRLSGMQGKGIDISMFV
jgi:hypothetical protein